MHLYFFVKWENLVRKKWLIQNFESWKSDQIFPQSKFLPSFFPPIFSPDLFHDITQQDSTILL